MCTQGISKRLSCIFVGVFFFPILSSCSMNFNFIRIPSKLRSILIVNLLICSASFFKILRDFFKSWIWLSDNRFNPIVSLLNWMMTFCFSIPDLDWTYHLPATSGRRLLLSVGTWKRHVHNCRPLNLCKNGQRLSQVEK